MVEAIEQEIFNKTDTNQHQRQQKEGFFYSGDVVITIGNNKVKKSIVGDDAELTTVNSFPFEDVNKAYERISKPAIDVKSEKVFAKIISISDNIVIELYLPDGEILRELKPYFKNIFAKQDLLYEDAEFYFVTIEKETGIEVAIEPYYREYKPELDAVYEELSKDF